MGRTTEKEAGNAGLDNSPPYRLASISIVLWRWDSRVLPVSDGYTTTKKRFTQQFGAIIAELNSTLIKARDQGIDVALEIAQSENYIVLNINVLGADTHAGRLLLESRSGSG